jgi:hypothetical protein
MDSKGFAHTTNKSGQIESRRLSGLVMVGRVITGVPVATDDWILASGFWDDGGFWRDNKFWID